MQLHFEPYLLELRYPFRLATGSRTHTNAMLTTLRFGTWEGRGEAAMPPYYGENHETAAAFLTRAAVLLQRVGSDLTPETLGAAIPDILRAVDALAPGNNAAKASIDIALYNLWAHVTGKKLWQLLGTNPANMPPTSFTLGMDTAEILAQKLAEATGFGIIKVKLGSDDDRQIIRTIRALSPLPIYVDANQGWCDRHAALDLIHWLAAENVQLIEQPTPKDDLDAAAWLTERSPLPIIADESFLRLSDLDRVASCFHGVNIKLMKCTGLYEGALIVEAARKRGLQLMVGCMTETSCGIMAAAALAPWCDFADIDGCWLIRNNPFELPALEHGKVVLP
jgi:L-Ala-D/L-Glu epimerase